MSNLSKVHLSDKDRRRHNRKVATKYHRKIPVSAADVPKGKVVVHNHVISARWLSLKGFRAWTQILDERIEICPCTWAPEFGEHYRIVAAEGSGRAAHLESHFSNIAAE